MTHKRSWLALTALLAAIVGGTVWAAEQEKKSADKAPAPDCCAAKCCAQDKCCAAEKEKTCCEAKNPTTEKCCSADGKCCGCCAKGPQTATLPVPPGSAIQLMIAPPGAFAEAGGPPEWNGFVPPMPPAPACPAVQVVPPTAPGLPCQTVQAMPPPPSVAVPAFGPLPMAGNCFAYAAAPRQAVSAWRLRAVVTNNRHSLAMKWEGDENTCVLCEDMVLQIGQESLKVSVAEKQVRVCGNSVTGSADAVTRNAADGSLHLEGHVKLHYGKEGQKVEVVAEQVVVGLADGRIEVKGLGRADTRPLPAPQAHPAVSVPRCCPACPASTDEGQQAEQRQQVFDFGRAGTRSLPVPQELPAVSAPRRWPGCPASTNDRQQVFDFWMGFFH